MKKNLLKVLAIALCLVMVVFAFAACGSKTEETAPAADTEQVGSGEAEAAEGEEAGEGSVSGVLVGTWEYVNGGYAYTFNEDGTGNYTAGETVMEFTYTDDGSAVDILYTGNTSANHFNFTIDGSKLSIEDSFGEKVDYAKK